MRVAVVSRKQKARKKKILNILLMLGAGSSVADAWVE